MKNTLNRDIIKILEQCGISLRGNDYTYGFDLPRKYDLISLSGVPYDKCDEETKLQLIQEYIWKKNSIRILNWKFFLPNLKTNKLEEEIFEYVLKDIRIYYVDNVFKFMFRNVKENLELMVKNKDFVERLSTEFQLKVIFSQNSLLLEETKKEMTKLICNKMKELKKKKKIKVELPKLIMDNLDINV